MLDHCICNEVSVMTKEHVKASYNTMHSSSAFCVKLFLRIMATYSSKFRVGSDNATYWSVRLAHQTNI